MAKPKRKLLPKSFEDLLKTGDLAALKRVFDECAVDARGGYTKQTALAYNDCPDELARWLVEQGADIGAEDTYGKTPLHSRAGFWCGRLEVLIDLGADVNHGIDKQGTPLHRAADVGNPDNVRLLLKHGAKPDALNSEGATPLTYALVRCNNAKLVEMADVAEILLAATPKPQTQGPSMFAKLFRKHASAQDPEMQQQKDLIVRIGSNFEFHRAGYNPDSVDAASAALDRLYAMFDVPPVPRRAMHDGKAPIKASAKTWEDQHQELWELLVPSSGPALTVQGEIIRISGRVHDEVYRNGGANWDRDYRKMADALLAYLSTGRSLPDSELQTARSTVASLGRNAADTQVLCRLAVEWVAMNPRPTKLGMVEYRR